MSGTSKIGFSAKAANVLKNTKARYVQEALRDRGFRSLRYGTNTYILKKLPQNQYQGFMKLLDVVRKHIRENYAVGKSELLPLTLPRAGKLRIVDFEKLIDSDAAMKKVFNLCVMPSGKLEVNFSVLPWIYNTEVVNK
jgi:hypothetical protein